jgi:hypothetical protein
MGTEIQIGAPAAADRPMLPISPVERRSTPVLNTALRGGG